MLSAKKRREVAVEQFTTYQRRFGELPPRGLFSADLFARVTGIYDGLLAVHGDNLRALHDDLVSLHFYLRWGHLGCPTFTLTHSLAAALLLTDCRRVRGEDVEMPFPSFEVILPDGLLTYDGPQRTVEASYLVYHQYGVAPDAVGVEADVQTQTARARDVVRRLRSGELSASYLEKQPATYVAVHSVHTTLGLHRTIHSLRPDESVERFLFDKTTGATRERLAPDVEYSALDAATIQGALRLIVNLSLYLRDLKRQGRWSPSPPRAGGAGAKPGRGTGGGTPLWSLGHEIKLDRRLLDAARARTGSEKRAWRVQSRFAVRGHWRRVACGEAQRERRLAFIQPYWRGPADGPQLLRQYQAGLDG